MAYVEKTISEIIELIDSHQIYLPAIQRKYVWGENQIVKLMDSIMRGYPFGTFLFWEVEKDVINRKGYSLYEFIKEYHERDHHTNEEAALPFRISDINPHEKVLSALDGQQRLTSLFISLKGSLAFKLPKKHWSNDDAFPKKELYLNLLSGNDENEDDEQSSYEFRFLTAEESEVHNDGCIWYKVKEIDQYPDIISLNKFIRHSEWCENDCATRNITTLFQRIKSDKMVSYFRVSTDSIDEVLDIFVRVNSGGTVLSKTDLLFSTIVSYWNDGRDEIDSLIESINKIGNHYSFSNDFIMKACLYVMDLKVSLKVELFKKDSVQRIKDAWPSIKESIKETISLLDELGFNSENIMSDNVVLPIVYYRFINDSKVFKNKQSRLEIRKFITVAQLNHIFGQSTSATLTSIRNVIKKGGKDFSLKQFKDLTFTGDHDLNCDIDDIDAWFDDFEKGPQTFMILSLLYPNLKFNQNGFHQDHMHPYSAFEKDDELSKLIMPNAKKYGEMNEEKIISWKHQRNTLANLQLLEESDNESKNATSLIEWLDEPANAASVKYLPQGISYELSNFDEFLEKRKQLMKDQLIKILL